MFKNLKIRSKLGIGAAILMVLIVILGASGYYYLDCSSASTEDMIKNDYGRIVLFKQIRGAAVTIDKAMLSMALTKSPSLKEEEKGKIGNARASYGEAVKKIEAAIAKIKDPKEKADVKNLLDKIKAELTKGKEFNVKLTEYAMEGKTDEASAIWSEHTSKVAAAIDSLFRQLVKVSEDSIEGSARENGKEASRAKMVFVTITLVVLISMGLGIFSLYGP